MKILQLITRRQYRGAEVFAGQLSEQLLQRGHSVIFAGLYPAPPRALSPEGTEYLDLNGHRYGIFPNLALLQRIARIVRDHQVNLVQANASDNLKYAVLSRKLFGWKAPIIYRNASVLSHWTRSALHRRVNRWLLNHCEAIACVSHETLRDLKERVGVNPALLHHLPIGTDVSETADKTESRRYLSRWVPVTEKDTLLIHIGSFTPEKNHHGLLRIFEKLEQELKGPVKLVLVGEGPLRSQIENQIKKEGQSDRIFTLGQRSDIQKLLAAADLFLLPSLIEGTPAVLLEAAAQSLPSIAYDVGAIRECFPEPAHNQLLTAKNDEAHFTSLVIDLLQNPEKSAKIGQELNDFVCENFSIERIADRFEKLYQTVVSTRKESDWIQR